MDLGLKGKSAVITGATRGIGRAIAEQLLSEGVNLAICARDVAAIEEAVAELQGKGAKVIGAPVDVADQAKLGAFIEQAAVELGGIDILIANVSVGNGPEKWEAAFDTDLMGTVRACEAVIPHMEKAGGGAIVMISTTAAFEVWNGAHAYGVFKAGLMNYAKNLADLQASKQIRVNSLAPGPVYFEGGAWTGIEVQHPDFFAKIKGSIPMGRMGSPADVAKAVTFLVSDAAAYITGVTLTVDGGRTRGVDF
jgi:NAD(P)-dependent dehydrogenase (short-subunit alcohol dehydrogenase family)